MLQNWEVTLKKTVLVSFSTILVALGVALFLQSQLGSDPMTVWVDGLRRAMRIPLGNASLIYNLVMLLLALIFARKYIHLGTVIASLGVGPMLKVLDPLLIQLLGANPNMQTRVAMMLTGQIILCYAIGLNLSLKFGFGTADALIVRLCESYHLKYKNVKILADLLYTLGGVLLGGIIGIGSLVAVVTGGPLITWFMVRGTDPMVEKLMKKRTPVCEEY